MEIEGGENLEIILSGAISGFIGVLGTYLIIKKVARDTIFHLIEEYFDLEKLGKDEKFAKFVFGVGGFLGKGLRSGVGMDKSIKPKDLVTQMIFEWWQDRRNTDKPTREVQQSIEKRSDLFKV